MTLAWTRMRDERGTFYRGVGKKGVAFHVTNYSRGEWGAEPEMLNTGIRAFWGDTKEEAVLAAELMAVGIDPRLHATRCTSQRHSVPPRGSWKAIWSWRCVGCDARSSGGYDNKSAHASALMHRLGAMQRQLDEARS